MDTTEEYKVNIEDIFPNITTGLSNIGFIFGAGTSKVAGYPLSKELSRNVFSKLSLTQKKYITGLLDTENIAQDLSNGIPDIEIVLDLIRKYLETNKKHTEELENSIQDIIIEELSQIRDPLLDSHNLFFSSLKKLMNSRSENIWIFTTNYDVLFELAAFKAKIPVCNGFEGIGLRYFDIDKIEQKYGYITKNGFFQAYKEPRIVLVKLHGSISWYKNNSDVFEKDWTDVNKATDKRAMILPRRNKVLESLEYPFDNLFRYATQVIGSSKCKYLISCGYSLRDQHINDVLILPKLKENKIRLTALFEEKPDNIQQFTQYNCFSYISKNELLLNNRTCPGTFNLWKYEELANLLALASNKGVVE